MVDAIDKSSLKGWQGPILGGSHLNKRWRGKQMAHQTEDREQTKCKMTGMIKTFQWSGSREGSIHFEFICLQSSSFMCPVMKNPIIVTLTAGHSGNYSLQNYKDIIYSIISSFLTPWILLIICFPKLTEEHTYFSACFSLLVETPYTNSHLVFHLFTIALIFVLALMKKALQVTQRPSFKKRRWVFAKLLIPLLNKKEVRKHKQTNSKPQHN